MDRSLLLAALPLMALAPATTAQEPLEKRVQMTLDQARNALKAHLQKNQGGPLVLCTLAAIHDGFPQDDAVFEDALERVLNTRLTGTYELALRLMILQEVANLPDREKLARKDCKALLRNYKRPGGFTYPTSRGDRNWDLSNTQYGALGLRAATALGCEVPKNVWRAMAATQLANQQKDGGFGYGPTTRRLTYASMTVAGIAVLEVCKQGLDDKLSKDFGAKIQRGVDMGWRWMGAHSKEIGDLMAVNSPYFHYGLERAAILSGKVKVGDADWYEEGAWMFVNNQLGLGGWETRSSGSNRGTRHVEGHGTPVDTAFAVLFLRRKFQRQLIPVTGQGRPKAIGALGPQATAEAIAKAAKLAAARGSAGMRDVLTAMASTVTTRRKAAAQALVLLCGTDFRFNPYRDQKHNKEAITKARAWLKANPYR